MKNTSFIVILMLLTTVFSCSKSIFLSVGSCDTKIFDINSNHPKGAEMQALLNKYVKKGLPGVTALIYTPEDGKWIGSAGFSRIEDAIPMQDCNIFHSASVAK